MTSEAKEWVVCARCGTKRPGKALEKGKTWFASGTDALFCIDADWCDRQKKAAAGLEGV